MANNIKYIEYSRKYSKKALNFISTRKNVAIKMASEVLKGRWNIFGHFRRRLKVFGKSSEISEIPVMTSRKPHSFVSEKGGRYKIFTDLKALKTLTYCSSEENSFMVLHFKNCKLGGL